MLEVKVVVYFVACILIVVCQDAEACEKPMEVKGVKAYCWSSSVLVGDKIQQMEKRVEEMTSLFKEPTEPQKCDYYYCIFKQMDLLNPNFDVPCQERLTDWIKSKIPANHADVLVSRVEKCTAELKSAKLSEMPYLFLADNVDLPEGSKVKTHVAQPQNSCSLAAEYMKCLGTVEKNQECPIFTYP